MKPTVILYNPKAVFYTMPLALLAIGSYLDRDKYNVVIVDGRFQDDSWPLLKHHLENNPVCFATTVLTGNPIKDALKYSRLVKQNYPHVKVVWGGWHPSLFPEQTLADPAIDIVVNGQGEIPFAKLLGRLLENKSLHGVNGLHFKDETGSLINNAPQVMQDINAFPAFNYELIDIPAYMKLSGRKQLDYISSQGCRFRCTFCADPFMYKRGWFGLDPVRIVDEIEQLWKKYQFEHVHFQDETFFTSSKRVKAFAEELIQRKLPITWFGTMRADQGVRLDDEVWKLCKQAGLEKVMIGMEAGTQEMLDWMKKDIKVNHILDAATKCVKYDIAINFSVIVGFPGETEASIDATLNMITRLKKMSPKFHFGIFYFKPYPGNPIADQLLKDGYQFRKTLEEWSDFDYVDSGKSEWISEEKIRFIENYKFYQHIGWHRKVPWILRKVAQWRIEKGNYSFPVERELRKLIKPTPQLS